MIGGTLTGASVDMVASPVGRMEDMNTHAMCPRAHTPEYTVTHTQMLGVEPILQQVHTRWLRHFQPSDIPSSILPSDKPWSG